MAETETDPFLDGTEIVNELGNSRPANQPKPKRAFGMQPKGKSKSTMDALWEMSSPDSGETRAIVGKAKPVSHMERAREYLKKDGWNVTTVETWRQSRSGASYRCDKFGIFDLECEDISLLSYRPKLWVQVCGKHADMKAHLRKMCSEDKAPDNRRPRIRNLLDTLLRGELVMILGFEMQDNGRYKAIEFMVDFEDVEECLARKAKRASRKTKK